jgi:hypothetical protein
MRSATLAGDIPVGRSSSGLRKAEAPGVEPCRRYDEKSKHCDDLHKVRAELAVSE